MNPRDYDEHGIRDLAIISSLDDSLEPSLFRRAPGDDPAPLLVGLHSWSMDRHNLVDSLLPVAQARGWHLLLPEFRGPNKADNPRCEEACGSRLAKQDILDAVDHVVETYEVDERTIFLYGGSGGAHMALLMAAYAPDRWRSVAAFCGITDLTAWHGQNRKYAAQIEACCGGPPGAETKRQYDLRSPVYWASDIARAEVTIYHGKYDLSVPHSQALRLYEAIHEADPTSRVFLTIFDGGHTHLPEDAAEQFAATLYDPNILDEITG